MLEVSKFIESFCSKFKIFPRTQLVAFEVIQHAGCQQDLELFQPISCSISALVLAIKICMHESGESQYYKLDRVLDYFDRKDLKTEVINIEKIFLSSIGFYMSNISNPLVGTNGSIRKYSLHIGMSNYVSEKIEKQALSRSFKCSNILVRFKLSAIVCALIKYTSTLKNPDSFSHQLLKTDWIQQIDPSLADIDVDSIVQVLTSNAIEFEFSSLVDLTNVKTPVKEDIKVKKVSLVEDLTNVKTPVAGNNNIVFRICVYSMLNNFIYLLVAFKSKDLEDSISPNNYKAKNFLSFLWNQNSCCVDSFFMIIIIYWQYFSRQNVFEAYPALYEALHHFKDGKKDSDATKETIYNRLGLKLGEFLCTNQIFEGLRRQYPNASLFESKGTKQLICSKNCGHSRALANNVGFWDEICTSDIRNLGKNLSVQQIVNEYINNASANNKCCTECGAELQVQRKVTTFPKLLAIRTDFVDPAKTIKYSFAKNGGILSNISYYFKQYALLGVIYGDGDHFVSAFRLCTTRAFAYNGLVGKGEQRVKDISNNKDCDRGMLPPMLCEINQKTGEKKSRMADTIVYRKVPS
jgi:hypothetical protein